MGTYLSTPVVDKGEESGEALECPVSPVAWGVVDMQGWRKSMEDAHVAQTDIQVPSHLEENCHDAKIFGVFDGHGGPEVARFCQLYMVDVITRQSTWIQEPPNKPNPKNPATSAVGQALINAFHAMDRMIDDRTRRDELVRLRSDKPAPGERRTTDSNPIPPTSDAPTPQPVVNDVNMEHAEHNPGNVPVPPQSDNEQPSQPKANDDGEPADDDSDKVVGEEEAAEMDRDMLEEEKTEGEGDDKIKLNSEQADKIVSALEREAMGLNGDEGQVVVVDITADPDETSDEMEAPSNVTASIPAAAPAPSPSTVTPTLIQNGRQICNLPDHPIHAGATAVVAILIGRTLTVANAGDSRAVLCRAGGRAEALSFDHKPHQDREMARIKKAGGFVNQFGRVNGNLNLSRSIGDLKYKQIPSLTPAEQMITAEPDIVQVVLHPNDEFVVFGCDGIWDCLTNDQAVKYVRDRIDTKTPTQIGAEMLDDIISEDPRATQGIGGDNMTIMIVDLQPQKRAYR